MLILSGVLVWCRSDVACFALGTDTAQSAAANKVIWSACAFMKDGRAVARVI